MTQPLLSTACGADGAKQKAQSELPWRHPVVSRCTLSTGPRSVREMSDEELMEIIERGRAERENGEE